MNKGFSSRLVAFLRPENSVSTIILPYLAGEEIYSWLSQGDLRFVKKQILSSKIWNRFADSIFFNDRRYVKHISLFLFFAFQV